jgi:hypothetical protein
MQALTKAKGSKVNLGVALAEARQTARLVGSTADKIGRMVNRYRSKNPRKVWDAVKAGGKAIPSSYLELSYGWTPLLQDVLGSAEALAESINLGRRFNLTVQGRASSRNPYNRVEKWPGLYDLIIRGESKSQVEVTLCYDLPSYLLTTLSSVGLTNPAEVLWEKVPYSFVVDWFLPIGNYLHLLDAGDYLQFIEGSRSVIARIKADITAVDNPDFNWRYNKYVTLMRPGMYRQHEFFRTVLTRPPEIPLPSLRAPLSLDKMAKGLALLQAAFSRRPWAHRELSLDWGSNTD